ncbi:ABC transporter permease [Lactobacillus alvi]|uniref:ABC transporter permease n=1 Tax=Limosilactobacillus alvi TaxID=990412 RepID=A0ABS2EN60_9LACO|nr:ABC transporter permease [Limosilactobacillus alvi]MBM6753929.1 ABC transporter permease [Limosilactobacillus alvi]
MSALFKTRKQSHLTHLLKYWRLVFNDHFVIALFFLFGALAYSYAQWLPKVTTGAVWVRPLIVIWLVLVSQIGRLATLVEKADPVVLLPQTSQFNSYFKQAWWYSYWRAGIISLAGLAICLPLYWRVVAYHQVDLFYFILVALLTKALWLLRARQTISFGLKKLPQVTKIMQWTEPMVIWGLTIWYPLVGLIVAMILLGITLLRVRQQTEINWRLATAVEMQRMDSVYRFFNLFTDVPSVQGKVKRRQWLSGLINWLAKGEGPWSYLYGHGFVRNVDVGNLVMRLTLVAMIVTYFVTVPWLNTALMLLFIYLVATQLMPFYHQYDQIAFTHLFPVSASEQHQAFEKLLLKIMICVGFLIVIGASSIGHGHFSLSHQGLNLILAMVEVWLLNRYYLKIRIK